MVRVRVLGGGREVGRSCVLVRGGRLGVLLDCGIHSGRKEWKDRVPLSLDVIKRHPPDAVVITHYHIDHVGALPFLTEVLGYKGPVYMTEPTLHLAAEVLADFVKVHGEDVPYTLRDVKRCLERAMTINLQQDVEVTPGLDIRCFYAGHALGAVMVQVILSDCVILYTGDVASTTERILGALRTSGCALPDVVITESTYATRIREDSRTSRERQLLSEVCRGLDRGGRVLIPAFAVGRTQELLVLLTSFWHRSNLRYPIHVSSALAQRTNDIFLQLSHTPWITDSAQKLIHSALHSKENSHLTSAQIEATHPKVLITAPAMLNAGFSRKVYRVWCQDARTVVALPGFGHGGLDCEGGGDAGTGSGNGRGSTSTDPTLPKAQCKIVNYSLSAHADAKGLFQLVRRLKAKHVILIHGEFPAMAQLQRLLSSDLNIQVDIPANGTTVDVSQSDRGARFCGSVNMSLATVRSPPSSSSVVDYAVQMYLSGSGVLRSDPQVQSFRATLPCHVSTDTQNLIDHAIRKTSHKEGGGGSRIGINTTRPPPSFRPSTCSVQIRSVSICTVQTESGRSIECGCSDSDDLPLARQLVEAIATQLLSKTEGSKAERI